MTAQRKRRSTQERLRERREKLEKEKAALAQLEEQRAGEIARLAMKAGLADVDVADDELMAGLTELAARFRAGPGSAVATEGAANGAGS